MTHDLRTRLDFSVRETWTTPEICLSSNLGRITEEFRGRVFDFYLGWLAASWILRNMVLD